MTDENPIQPKERQPLMNKLEPTHSTTRNVWHDEGKAWSKTGRDMVYMVRDLLEWLLG